MAGQKSISKPVPVRNEDEIDFEYKFYCLLIRDLSPLMPQSEEQRNKLTRWIHLLVDPLASTQDLEFRVKRNLYLFMICAALLTGNCQAFMKIAGEYHLKADAKRKPVKVQGMKSSEKPEPIADTQGVPVSIASALNPAKFAAIDTFPEWQRENCWEIRLQAAQEMEKLALKNSKMRIHAKKDEKKCSIHDEECPQDEVVKKIGRCLDNQFKYLLTLAESYQQVMTSEKEKINLWLQALAKIDKDSCVDMKGIRNEYMMLLVGYLVNNELKGPFEDLPTSRLQPLTQAVATYIAKRKTDGKEKDAKGQVPLNPVSDTVEAFMNSVPKIEEGAFAFLSLSGNLFGNRR